MQRHALLREEPTGPVAKLPDVLCRRLGRVVDENFAVPFGQFQGGR